MKSPFFVLVTACLTLGCAGLSKVITYPSANIKGVDVGGVSLTALTLKINVEIENPYSTELPLVGVDYAISTRGTTFAEGELESQVVIPAKESREVPLSVRLPFNEIRDVVEGFEDNEIPYRADLGLKVEAPVVGSIRLPVDAEGTLTLPSLPWE